MTARGEGARGRAACMRTGGVRAWLATGLLAAALAGCGAPAAKEEPAAEEKGPSPADSGVVVLTADAVRQAGITVVPAGPGTVDLTLSLPGEVKPDPSRVLEVKPRFAGVVRQVLGRIGSTVRRGDVLARVESNESLTQYPVTASITGRVVQGSVAPGQNVTQETVLFTVADLSRVWIEFGVYPNQIARIRRGQPVALAPTSGGGPVERARIDDVGPTLQAESRVSTGRVVLANPAGRWEPGMFVDVVVTVDHVNAAVTVPDEAVVRMPEGSAVFVASGGRFRLQPVAVGRTDGVRAEIVSGVAAGTPVVAHHAYVVKSELEKSQVEE